jgi:hypothetical protein
MANESVSSVSSVPTVVADKVPVSKSESEFTTLVNEFIGGEDISKCCNKTRINDLNSKLKKLQLEIENETKKMSKEEIEKEKIEPLMELIKKTKQEVLERKNILKKMSKEEFAEEKARIKAEKVAIEKKYLEETKLHRYLRNAACGGNLSRVKKLIKQGADVNFIDKDIFIISTLGQASSNGHLEVVKYLLDNGADINIRNNNLEYTPLILASQEGHFEIVEELLKRGADKEHIDGTKRKAIDWATCRGHNRIVSLLS